MKKEKKKKHAFYLLAIPATWQPNKQALSHQLGLYGLQIVYGLRQEEVA